MNEKPTIRIMEVVLHNSLWENHFLCEADKINNIMKAEIVNIHHIGSTCRRYFVLVKIAYTHNNVN